MNENMLPFLLYEYFGEYESDNIEDVSVSRAYLDLCRRMPYQYSYDKPH